MNPLCRIYAWHRVWIPLRNFRTRRRLALQNEKYNGGDKSSATTPGSNVLVGVIDLFCCPQIVRRREAYLLINSNLTL